MSLGRHTATLLCSLGLAGCAADSADTAASQGSSASSTTAASGSTTNAAATSDGASTIGSISTAGAVTTTAGAATGTSVGGATATATSGGGGGATSTSDVESTTVTSAESSSGTTAGGTNSFTGCEDAATLREAAACTGRPIGVALRDDRLNDSTYAAAAREFDYVTAENEMKWDATEPSRGQFNFNRGDAIVNFAMQNDMAVKGHTLVWHSQLPSWVSNISSESELRQVMRDHIEGVAGHYRGKVDAWDVVNEAISDNAGARRNSVFQQLLGDTFIDEAFIMAHEVDPDAKLYYNDYDISNADAKGDAAYELVAGLVERGVPIDGVGMQMHTRSSDEDPTLPDFEANLQRIVALGLEVLISEMDVRLCSGTNLENQKTRYHDIIELCLSYPGCTAVTIWGVADRDSWLNQLSNSCVDGGAPVPLLWDDGYDKKPAYDGVMDALLGR